jgi:hypothetical protein
MLYLRISPNGELPTYDGKAPYRAVVIVEEPVLNEWQWRVSSWLVQSGCLYMMAWGINCSSWDDSVDHANLEEFDYGDIPEDRFVMTTWHDGATLGEVFTFAKTCAKPKSDNVELQETVLLHISSVESKEKMELIYETA